MNVDERQTALGYLGIPYTRRGDELVQHYEEVGHSEPADDTELQVALDNPPPEPADVPSFIEALIGYFGIDRAEDLMREYPTFIRSLDGGTRWDIAQSRMAKMLSDEMVTQQEFDDVQGLWDQFNLPRE